MHERVKSSTHIAVILCDPELLTGVGLTNQIIKLNYYIEEVAGKKLN